jgi:hypothetical protein
MGNVLCNTKKRGPALFAQQKAIYQGCGQSHLLEDYETLTAAQKESLLDEMESFDPKIISKLYKDLVVDQDQAADAECNLDRIEQDLTISTSNMSPVEHKKYY